MTFAFGASPNPNRQVLVAIGAGLLLWSAVTPFVGGINWLLLIGWHLGLNGYAGRTRPRPINRELATIWHGARGQLR